MRREKTAGAAKRRMAFQYQDSAEEQSDINELGALYRFCPDQGRRVMMSATRAIAKEFEDNIQNVNS